MTHRDHRNRVDFDVQTDPDSGGSFVEILELLVEHGFEGCECTFRRIFFCMWSEASLTSECHLLDLFALALLVDLTLLVLRFESGDALYGDVGISHVQMSKARHFRQTHQAKVG